MNIKEYITELSLRGYSPDTLRAYTSDLKHFSRFLEKCQLRLNQVTTEVVGEYLAAMKSTVNGRRNSVGLAQATIERRLASLGSFYAWQCHRNPRKRNPVSVFRDARPRMRRIQDPQGQALDESSLESLMVGIDNLRDRAMLALFLTSGLRLSELARLDIDSISKVTEPSSDGSSRLYGTGTVMGKGSKERRFYFDGETVDLIDKYVYGRTDDCTALFISERRARLSPRAIQQTFANWCHKLGLKHFHVHQLRHTYATRLANAEIDALVLKELMGHEHFETTSKYFRLAEDVKASQYYGAMEAVRVSK